MPIAIIGSIKATRIQININNLIFSFCVRIAILTKLNILRREKIPHQANFGEYFNGNTRSGIGFRFRVGEVGHFGFEGLVFFLNDLEFA